jgi:hypothetical protein
MRRGEQDVGAFLAFLAARGYSPHRLAAGGHLAQVSTAELEALESTVDLLWRRGIP